MKLGCLAVVAVAAATFACGGAPKSPVEAAQAEPAAPIEKIASREDMKTAAEKWAEEKSKTETASVKGKSGGDPLDVGAELDAASVPKVEHTPKKELRGQSRAAFDAAMGVVKQAKTVDDAAAKLVARLGKPTWIEDGRKRVWVAKDRGQCHRLVLDSDGSVEVETAGAEEWRMLSALAQQSPCTGEIKRGVPGSK
ncbi:MAG: hypothetical protein KF819_15105 [Labilithrix sp.]|nr:hypothetical protein [Labilithrix sp.]